MRSFALALLALCGALMISDLTWRLRRARREVAETYESADRYVDMGVRYCVVRQDSSIGEPLLPGKPPLVVLRSHVRGGILDRELGHFIGPSRRPVTWYLSEASEPLVLHGNDMPLRLLAEGAMGAGKSVLLCQWTATRALEATGTGAEIGLTAPTTPRLGEIKRALLDLIPRQWGTWRERDQTFTLRNGVVIRCVSTHQSSAAEGSPVQGYSWIACGSDEIQDSLHVDGDIEARGRDAPDGRYKRCATATVKDAPTYRAWRDRVRELDVWGVYRMTGQSSPFVPPKFWEDLRKTMPPREYARKVLAADIPAETRIYYTWDHDRNLRAIPQLGAVDVTADVLAPLGPNFGMLVGHDPGALVDYSVMLKAYRIAGQRRPTWFVVDELQTTRTTSDEHGRALLAKLRTHGLHRLDIRNQPLEGSPIALIHADPYSDSGAESRGAPHKSVYVQLGNLGLTVRPAAYAKPKAGATIGATGPGMVPKLAGIKMIVGLLCDASDERRLFVACDDKGPLAPHLVESLEMQEYDPAGRAEWQRKRVGDTSHPVAALRYALWRLEAPRHENEPVGREARR